MAALKCPFFTSSAATLPSPHNVDATIPRPSPQEEFTRIRSVYPALASTGCTASFCQSGRMKHTDEERVGRNQPLEATLRDAADFLHQLRHGGVISSERELNARTEQVLRDVREKATYGRYTAVAGSGSDAAQTSSLGLVGGTWTQSFEELEFGIRQAWKHSRKCIMRSEYKDLKLCDLRHVNTSAQMGTELISALKEAFNAGEIRPTVFMFPPREPNERGPMVMNSNLLSFAGYLQEDGSVLGDPVNVELTKAIIELGWKPPVIRTRWDMLPIVTMAQGDRPVITEVPQDAFPLVHIQHPRHRLAFEKLGLRWVPAPALSRLGFTIGGVQYTASPFIGWFMDAEIGVRNLVDPFRYNVLPQVIKQMGLFDGDLNDLPDFERLALMSRAQTELNYAASWSFAKAKVRMIDSLSASELFSRFDDDHLADNGYRLPSDPYWLAPPQGSIIPLWHRGASPNYQPKPMICHHVQDPIKVWRREQSSSNDNKITLSDVARLSIKLTVTPSQTWTSRKIYTGYCSSGTVALKLCKKLVDQLTASANASPYFGKVMPVQPLSALARTVFDQDDLLLVIASNTRRGEMPQNGVEFLRALQRGDSAVPSRFAIFGNGSRDYPDTYCETAKILESSFAKRGAVPMIDAVYADTAAENPPWSAFGSFSKQVVQSLNGAPPTPDSDIEVSALELPQLPPKPVLVDTKASFCAKITGAAAGGPDEKGMKLVTLDIGDRTYPPMSYISVLPPNLEAEVDDVLRTLNIQHGVPLAFAGGISIKEFLRYHVDLRAPFRNVAHWASDMASQGALDLAEFGSLPVSQAASRLPADWRSWTSLKTVCQALPKIQPRKYSAASDYDHAAARAGGPGRLELLVQHHDGGRFSDHCLGSPSLHPGVAARIERAAHLERLASAVDAPLVLFSTGSGIAPIRALLRHRAHLLGSAPPGAAARHAPITLIAGCRRADQELVRSSVAEAEALGLLDVLSLTPSNPERRRAQDAVFDEGVREKVVGKLRKAGRVFVCAKPEAEEDFLANLSALLGVVDIREALGERYISDVYQPAV